MWTCRRYFAPPDREVNPKLAGCSLIHNEKIDQIARLDRRKLPCAARTGIERSRDRLYVCSNQYLKSGDALVDLCGKIISMLPTCWVYDLDALYVQDRACLGVCQIFIDGSQCGYVVLVWQSVRIWTDGL